MFKKNKSTIILNHFIEQLENNLFDNSKLSSITIQKKDSINKNKIAIPKINLNNKKSNSINLIEEKKELIHREKLINMIIMIILKKNFPFYFFQKIWN